MAGQRTNNSRSGQGLRSFFISQVIGAFPDLTFEKSEYSLDVIVRIGNPAYSECRITIEDIADKKAIDKIAAFRVANR